ncbi:hypothetical protein GI582_09090 [Sulfitobacter sp. BDSS02]|nr:hypothetical protein [Sulfitobacter sp. BDSS02]MBR9849876.1 hypothetical protein [Paracoccaceae bacterium]
MQISYGVPIVAPQITGHPAGLPADAPPPDSDKKVTEASAKSESDSASSRDTSSEESTPPTAMQRKIMEILEQQAEELT